MEKYIFVEYLNSINTVISNTFKSTQRIKLKSFDVSNNYIIFGANSGGIYVFKRNPCEFLRLIPSKAGSASKILISTNEKNLAIATSKGSVIVLENVFNDFNFRPLVYSEHEGNTITCMTWEGNNIYSGDNSGKVSVITLGNLLTKAIFQNTSTVLMQLDSSVVQLDARLNHLLISTKTKTFLCDTEKEHYKQIGKKNRDGNFGACFHEVSVTEQNFVDENEVKTNVKQVQIYCARPGVRLWRADFEAAVVVTYQFRNSLINAEPAEIYEVGCDPNDRLNVKKHLNDKQPNCGNFNFKEIYSVANRFIFSYDNNGIYFFDPINSSLAFWSEVFGDIKDVKVGNNAIYVWQSDLTLKVINVDVLEDVLIRILFNKQYYLCADFCFEFEKDLKVLAGVSKKLHLLSVLKSKLEEREEHEVLDRIKPLLEEIVKFKDECFDNKTSSNGVVVIENLFASNKLDHFNSASIEIELEGADSRNVENGKKSDCLDSAKNDVVVNSDSVEEVNITSLLKQYQLNKSHRNLDIPETMNLWQSLKLNECFDLIEKFIKHVEDVYNEDASLWCKQQFLKVTSMSEVNFSEISNDLFEFISESYLDLNKTDGNSCKCNFPLPKSHKVVNEPKYYNLGCDLLKFHKENYDLYTLNIPYFYKFVLRNKLEGQDRFLNSNLALIVQFSDREILRLYQNEFTYDIWDEVIKLFIKLREGFCLNCNSEIDIDGALSWTELGNLMIQSTGPVNAVLLLERYSKNIRNGELDSMFYQSCILSMAFDDPVQTVKFMENAVEVSSNVPDQSLKTYLNKKHTGQNLTLKKNSIQDEQSKCSYCELPLGPIIKGQKRFECGHNFHVVCVKVTGFCRTCNH